MYFFIIVLLSIFLATHAKHSYPSDAYNVENEYCPHQQFIAGLQHNVDENGALLNYDNIFRNNKSYSGSSIKSSLSSEPRIVYPCYNRAYTSNEEQWDGLKDILKLKQINQECYFNVGVCNKYNNVDANVKHFYYETTSNSNNKHMYENTISTKIFVPSNVPYIKKLFSKEQIGQCKTKCEYVYPTLNSYKYNSQNILELKDEVWKHVTEKYDGVLFPFDWSYGSMSAIAPNTLDKVNQTWIAFSEEDVLDPNGGRPELWSNSSLMEHFDIISTYDYAMSNVPFNLYRYHFWGPCTVNMYFRYISYSQFDSTLPLISYASRNCRPQRDNIVSAIMKFVNVAAIGKCLNNSPWPFEKATYPYWQEKILALQKYKFTLALQGYDKGGLVSEKLYDAFAAGTVPIFYGISRVVVEKFAPSPNSFLHFDDFDTIENLALFVKKAGQNELIYNKLHEWRHNGVNKRFCSLLNTNVNSIACRVCEKVHDETINNKKSNVDITKEETDIEKKLNNIDETTTVLVIIIRSTNTDIGMRRRRAIRNTWGKDIQDHRNVRLFFLIPWSSSTMKHHDQVYDSSIHDENQLFNDMLIAPSSIVFDDDVRTVNFGNMNDTIWCMKELISRIDDFWYMYMGYDDSYLNALTLVTEMSNQVRLFSFYVGTVNEAITGETIMTDRSIVDVAKYPLNTLPPYALDRHYMLSSDNIRFIVQNLRNLRALPLEDEGITLTLWLLGLQVHPENHNMFQSFKQCNDENGNSGVVLSLSEIPNADKLLYDIYNRKGAGMLNNVCGSIEKL